MSDTPTPTDPREEKDFFELLGEGINERAKERADLESTNSKLAAEIAELKAKLEHYGSVAEWMGKPTSDLHTELIRLRAELEAARKEVERLKGKTMAMTASRVREQMELGNEIARAVEQRDTALAAKDAAEKRAAELDEFMTWIRGAVAVWNDPSHYLYNAGRVIATYLPALTPAPTQEAPAGGVTISNDSSSVEAVTGVRSASDAMLQASRHATTGQPVPIRSSGPGEQSLPTESGVESLAASNSESSASPAVTISTEKKGGEAGMFIESPPMKGASDVQPEGRPADVPSEGRGEWMPFNLSDALAGKPVVTRDGSWTGVVEPDSDRFDDYPAIARINGGYYFIRADGRLFTHRETDIDLFMLPTEGSGA